MVGQHFKQMWTWKEKGSKRIPILKNFLCLLGLQWYSYVWFLVLIITSIWKLYFGCRVVTSSTHSYESRSQLHMGRELFVCGTYLLFSRLRKHFWRSHLFLYSWQSNILNWTGYTVPFFVQTSDMWNITVIREQANKYLEIRKDEARSIAIRFFLVDVISNSTSVKVAAIFID